jgi:hypothetical protein
MMILLAMVVLASTAAANFEQNHYYCSARPLYPDIVHYDETGVAVETFSFPATVTTDVRDLAFGPDGLLYVVVRQTPGFAVLALDDTMTIQETYPVPSGWVLGNVVYGKIFFDDGGQFYVVDGTGMYQFSVGDAFSATLLFAGGGYGAALLPSGNFLFILDYNLREISPTGVIIREIATAGARYVNLRAVAYDESDDTIFLSMLGDSGQGYHRVLHIASDTGDLIHHTTFTYTFDLLFDNSGNLVLGSNYYAPGVFTKDLVQLGAFGGSQAAFVAQVRDSTPGVPTISTAGLIVLAIAISVVSCCALDRGRWNSRVDYSQITGQRI